jgi:antitoxin component of MazEF toxin-antitoxin module
VGEHSLSFVLPKKYATELGIVKGDYVKVSQRDGMILIEKSIGEEVASKKNH